MQRRDFLGATASGLTGSLAYSRSANPFAAENAAGTGPKDGRAQADLIPDGHRTMEARAKAGDGWRVPPNPSPPDTSEADLRWIAERRLPQSLKCFVQPLKLHHGEATLPRTYIYCKRIPPGDPFSQFADRARQEHWSYYEMDATHSPHITAPDALAAVLRSVAAAPNK